MMISAWQVLEKRYLLKVNLYTKPPSFGSVILIMVTFHQIGDLASLHLYLEELVEHCVPYNYDLYF